MAKHGKQNQLFKKMGSIQKESCLTFSFSPKVSQKKKKYPNCVPFQLQYTYTGSKSVIQTKILLSHINYPPDRS